MKKLITFILINCLIISLSFGQKIGLKIGDIAPELAYNNPKGKEMKLSSLRGKLVLIDFWANWSTVAGGTVFAKYWQSGGRDFLFEYTTTHSTGLKFYFCSGNGADRTDLQVAHGFVQTSRAVYIYIYIYIYTHMYVSSRWLLMALQVATIS